MTPPSCPRSAPGRDARHPLPFRASGGLRPACLAAGRSEPVGRRGHQPGKGLGHPAGNRPGRQARGHAPSALLLCAPFLDPSRRGLRVFASLPVGACRHGRGCCALRRAPACRGTSSPGCRRTGHSLAILGVLRPGDPHVRPGHLPRDLVGGPLRAAGGTEAAGARLVDPLCGSQRRGRPDALFHRLCSAGSECHRGRAPRRRMAPHETACRRRHCHATA